MSAPEQLSVPWEEAGKVVEAPGCIQGKQRDQGAQSMPLTQPGQEGRTRTAAHAGGRREGLRTMQRTGGWGSRRPDGRGSGRGQKTFPGRIVSAQRQHRKSGGGDSHWKKGGHDKARTLNQGCPRWGSTTNMPGTAGNLRKDNTAHATYHKS